MVDLYTRVVMDINCGGYIEEGWSKRGSLGGILDDRKGCKKGEGAEKSLLRSKKGLDRCRVREVHLVVGDAMGCSIKVYMPEN